jgi:hypothetical protein
MAIFPSCHRKMVPSSKRQSQISADGGFYNLVRFQFYSCKFLPVYGKGLYWQIWFLFFFLNFGTQFGIYHLPFNFAFSLSDDAKDAGCDE